MWRTQPWLETTMPGKVEKARIEAVSTATIAVPLQADHAHIVVEHLVRHVGEIENRVLVAPRYRRAVFQGRKSRTSCVREAAAGRMSMPRVSKLSAHATFLT